MDRETASPSLDLNSSNSSLLFNDSQLMSYCPLIHNIIYRTAPRQAENLIISAFQESTLIESVYKAIESTVCPQSILLISTLQKWPSVPRL